MQEINRGDVLAVMTRSAMVESQHYGLIQKAEYPVYFVHHCIYFELFHYLVFVQRVYIHTSVNEKCI